MFEFDFLSLLCNMNTLQNTLMLGTNQDEITCCVQEWQLLAGLGGHFFFFFFFSKKPFLVVLIFEQVQFTTQCCV